MKKPIRHLPGSAAEYAPYALKIYDGCVYGCKYCYVPHATCNRVQGRTAAQFHEAAPPVESLLEDLDRQTSRAYPIPGHVLLSFMSDPYPPVKNILTREVLKLLARREFRVAVLTKSGMEAKRDFDLMQENCWWYGATVTMCNDDNLSYPDCTNCNLNESLCPAMGGSANTCPRGGWEPYAAPFADRAAGLQIAHDAGIRTWVSLEPIINPYEALAVIERLRPWVDHWKIGKLNSRTKTDKEVEQSINWSSVLREITFALEPSYSRIFEPGVFHRSTYYIKHSLMEAANDSN